MQSNTRTIRNERNRIKKTIINSYTPVSEDSKKDFRVNLYLYNLYLKNKKLTSFYLHANSIIDIRALKLFNTEPETTIKKINTILNNWMVQHTTKDAILKSLSIFLYHQFRNCLKLSKFDCEVYTNERMYYLYDYKQNYEEFNKNIYIKATIGFTPIFGSKKDKHFNQQEKAFIKKSIFHVGNLKEILKSDLIKKMGV